MMKCDKIDFIPLPLNGKSIVHTGLSVAEGEDLENRIKRWGGFCKSSVSSATDYLIVNPEYKKETVKYAKALELRESGKNDKIRILNMGISWRLSSIKV